MCDPSKHSVRVPLTVTLAGHSQAPAVYDNFDGNHLTIYKQGGANLWDLDNPRSPLYPALRTRVDVFILLLGGNDLFLTNNNSQCISPEVIKNKLREIISRAKEISSHVFICQLEKRYYQNSRKQIWAANADYYLNVARSINQGLTRNANSGGYRCIRLTQGVLEDRKADGVHFTEAGSRELYRRVKLAVRHCM